MPSRDRLTINRFRDVDTDGLDDDEYLNYVFAKLMQTMIERLEGSIQNDRIFNRTKYDVMALFHDARALLDKRAQYDAQP